MATKPRILIDMDEVLVNFNDGLFKIWGLTRDEVMPYWDKGIWSARPALTKALYKKGLRNSLVEMTLGEFWKKLEGREDFWTNLENTSYFHNLMYEVTSRTDDWHIVSSPSMCMSSYTGKTKWLKNMFGTAFRRYHLTSEKNLLANKYTILIDDSDDHIWAFENDKLSKGHGILFPCHHNSMHDQAYETKAQLESVVARLDITIRHMDFSQEKENA